MQKKISSSPFGHTRLSRREKSLMALKSLMTFTPYSDFFVTFASLITHYSIIP